jgi:dipeptidyl aminopeptidase/acylaminoacyl peptidase
MNTSSHKFMILVSVLLLCACAAQAHTPEVATVESSPTPTIFLSPIIRATPTPTECVACRAPGPEPTIDPTALPDFLRAAITLKHIQGLDNHPIQQVTGYKGVMGPYWLDNTHLFFYAITGWGKGYYGPPMVMNVSHGKTWLPTNGRLTVWSAAYEPLYPGASVRDASEELIWSEPLKVLGWRQGDEITLYNLEGQVLGRYDAGIGITLFSPSGQQLVTQLGWYDLKTGKMLNQNKEWGIWKPAWSSDETRLFGNCLKLGQFAFADARSGEFKCFAPDNPDLVAEEGFPTRYQWVYDDKRVMIVDTKYNYPTYKPVLIDPMKESYADVYALAGLDRRLACRDAHLSPDGRYLLVSCQPVLSPESTPDCVEQIGYRSSSGDLNWLRFGCENTHYIVDMSTLVTKTISTSLEFADWSSNGQYILLTSDRTDPLFEISVLEISSGQLFPLASACSVGPVWSPEGERLAFLSEDTRVLNIYDASTHATIQVTFPQYLARAIWRPQGNGLAVLAVDGSVWWTPDPAAGRVEQLTLPRQYVGDVSWSPDGTQLAFVGGTDVYVVSVKGSK